jgi:hypothetical protein
VSLEKEGAALAEAVLAHAEKVADAGLNEYAIWLFRTAETIRQASAGVTEALQRRHHSGNVRDMVTAERVRHSKGTASEDPLRAAANDAGYTIRSLAEKLSISHALLSKARKGERSIEKALAAEIQKLTGFPATKKNWPLLKE